MSFSNDVSHHNSVGCPGRILMGFSSELVLQFLHCLWETTYNTATGKPTSCGDVRGLN